MNIDRLQQTVTMVAHGTVTDQDIIDITQQLIDADVPTFGKIIEDPRTRRSRSCVLGSSWT